MNVMSIVENFNSKMTGQINGNRTGRAMVTEKAENLQPGKDTIKTEDIKAAITELNNLATGFDDKIKFSLDEKTKQIVIKLIDRDTNEVVGEIPSKYSIRLLEHFQQSMGLFIDESR